MDKFYQTADQFTAILPSTMAPLGYFADAVMPDLLKKFEQAAQHIPENPFHVYIYYNGIQFRPIAGCNEFPRTKQFLYTFNLPCGLNQNCLSDILIIKELKKEVKPNKTNKNIAKQTSAKQKLIYKNAAMLIKKDIYCNKSVLFSYDYESLFLTRMFSTNYKSFYNAISLVTNLTFH